jgi:histidyl-tRNA synthetase
MTDTTDKMQDKVFAVKGMNDILPADGVLWDEFERAVRSLAAGYGYQQIRTPIVEMTRLFRRGIGAVTDIVEKEMYSFTDALNGDDLSLRPESTAGVVRAVIEHNMLYDGPKRLWYLGPMFRHERPQRGRYRQFHQFGVEALGFTGPDVDAEVILMGQRLWDDLGLSNIRLEINSIGSADERATHRAALTQYLLAHESELDEDSKRRLSTNPLRILDTKNPALQAMVNAAPSILDFLGEASQAHFKGLQRYLLDAGIAFKVNPRLVRGLDYYNLTVFEWVTDALGAQGTVCGGGRYDPLIELLGGRAAPACGFAIGVERLIELMREQGRTQHVGVADVFVAHQGVSAARLALTVSEELRGAGFQVLMHCEAQSGGSFKSQMKRADASGAQFAVIMGDDEVAEHQASVKALRSSDGAQTRVPLDQLTQYLIDATLDSSEFLPSDEVDHPSIEQ